MTPPKSRNMAHQHTLKASLTFKGVGLHSGSAVTCTLHPADVGTGIVFRRSDLRGKPQIRADISRVVRTDLSTMLGDNQGTVIGTVEHLMAALRGMGVDHAIVDVNGPEIPIMDGSSLEFAQGIASVGLKTVASGRKVLRLRKAVQIQVQDKWIKAQPYNALVISGAIDFKHTIIGEQSYEFGPGGDFLQELAAARTFGFLKEVEYMHKKGLAKGGSLQNAIVLDEQRVLNPEGLRFDDEFVRHKVLDALGDFALLGLAMQARIQVNKSGHELHALFLQKILEEPSQYEIIELSDAGEVSAPDSLLDMGFAVPA
jgi:UDP-3-O-[3-hydroxymyristoyl] N-acetylglucosamine deacetylase